MSTKIIYHQTRQGVDCPDGIAAAWVAHRAMPGSQVIGCWYQCEEKDLPVVDPGDRVFVVDFSFDAEILRKWELAGAEITLIDHHKTAYEHLVGRDIITILYNTNLVFDMQKCGAILAWEHFFPDEPIPRFLLHIQDRDLWNFALDKTEEVHEAMGKIGRSFDLFDLCASQTADEFLCMFAPIGSVLLQPKRKAVATAVERVELRTENNEPFMPCIPTVVLSPDGSEDRLTSEICAELYKKFAGAPFVQCITSGGTYSLRSDKNKTDGGFDVGAYAKERGGGGHKNAAGYRP